MCWVMIIIIIGGAMALTAAERPQSSYLAITAAGRAQ
jgi:hypothetical protein